MSVPLRAAKIVAGTAALAVVAVLIAYYVNAPELEDAADVDDLEPEQCEQRPAPGSAFMNGLLGDK